MIIGQILFFLLMFAPRAWQSVKIPLVVLAVVLLVYHYVRHSRKKLNYIVMGWFAILLSFGFIWSLVGALNDNPGLLDLFRLNVIWVVLYALFVFYIDTLDKYNSLTKTMVWATIAISLYNFAIALSAFDYIPNINDLLQIDSEYTSHIGIHEGFLHLTSHNIGSLTFLAPFVWCLYAIRTHTDFGISRTLLLIAVISSIVAVLISGRRVLWLEMMVAPILLLTFSHFTSDKGIARNIVKLYLVMFLFLIVAGYYSATTLEWNYSDMQEHFTSAFVSEEERKDQSIALWNGFLESPLVGSGFGRGVGDVVRDDAHPWNYELSYMLLLYNTGILGSVVYAFCLGQIYYFGIKQIKYDICDISIMISLLVAFSCFILANATNPYLQSFDFMWALFLPIAYINISLLRQYSEKEYQK